MASRTRNAPIRLKISKGQVTRIKMNSLDEDLISNLDPKEVIWFCKTMQLKKLVRVS